MQNKKLNNKYKKENINLNNSLEEFIKLNSNAGTAAVWRSKKANAEDYQKDAQTNPRIETGFAALTQLLAFNGWPLNGINELNLEQHGIGELRLLIPALQTFETQNILLIAPPLLPFAPALAQYGFDLEHWLVAQTDSIQERLWAAEQALLSDSCAAVLCWTDHHILSHKHLRRLQLASKKSNSWFVLLRDQACLQTPSPASLRLHLKINNYGQLNIKVVKQVGGTAGHTCTLSLAPHYENWQRLPIDLWPQSNTEQVVKLPMSRLNKTTTPINNKSVVVLQPLSELQSVH